MPVDTGGLDTVPLTPSALPSSWDEYQAHLYKYYNIHNNYELHEGLAVLPVALTDAEVLAGTPSTVVVRLHSPYRIRKVTFNTEKQNAPPVIPLPTSVGAFTYLGGAVAIPYPTLNGTLNAFDWSAAGTYSFVESVPSQSTDGYVIGMTPWTMRSQQENAGIAGIAIGFGIGGAAGAASALPGAASEGGIDVQVGGFQAVSFDFNNPVSWYNTPSYFPASFTNSEMLNGGPS